MKQSTATVTTTDTPDTTPVQFVLSGPISTQIGVNKAMVIIEMLTKIYVKFTDYLISPHVPQNNHYGSI